MNLNVDLKKLNELDLKALVNAPNSIKMAALVVVLGMTLFAGYWFIWRDEISALNVAKQDELSLKNQYTEKANQTVNLDAYRMQLGEVKQSFQAMLSQLPINSSIGAILSDINQAGLERGLNFEFIKPGSERVQRFYVEIPIQIQMDGDYHDMGKFASDVAQMTRIATLRDLHITRSKEGGQLSMQAEIDTYRYLNSDELDAQKSVKKGGG